MRQVLYIYPGFINLYSFDFIEFITPGALNIYGMERRVLCLHGARDPIAF